MKESTTETTVDSAESVERHEYERPIGTDESVCEAVVSAVTTVENVDMDDIEPLYSAVDGDALERITASNTISCVSFDYVGYWVEVHGRSHVILTPSE